MSTRLGEAYITISADISDYEKNLERTKSKTTSSVKDMQTSFDTLNSSLATGIQQTTYGIDAGSASIVKSYAKMRDAARNTASSTISDFKSMDDRIREYAEETRKRELSVWQTPDQLRASWGMSPRDDQARIDAGLQPLGDQQYAASDAMRQANQGLSDQTVAVGAAALKWGVLGAAVAGVSEIVITGYQRMEQAAKDYLESAEKIANVSYSGISTGQIQNLQAASKIAGLDSDVLIQGYRNISAALAGFTEDSGKAKEALDAMHISLVDQSGQAKTFNDVIAEIANQFALYEDSANKSKLATDIFGTSQGQLISLLSKGGSAVQQYMAASQNLSDAEVKKAAAFQESERVQQLAVEQANASMGKAWHELTSDLLRVDSDWNSALKTMSETVSQFGNLATAVFDRVKVAAGFLPASLDALKSVARSGSVTPGEVINVGPPVTGASQKGPAPTVLSGSDFEKTLTERRNQEQNLFTWEAENSKQYWSDAYQWSVGYYGKDSQLAKDLWNKYADAARGAQEKASSSGADPFSVEQIRGKISQVETEFNTMYRDLHAAQYDFWTRESESQGRFIEAAALKNWKTYETAVAGIAQQTAKAQTSIQQLTDKLGSERGADPEAAAAMQKEISRLQELVTLDKERVDYARKLYDLSTQNANLKTASELARVNVSYVQLTGTMEEQLRAQLALIDAQAQEKLGIEWRTANLDKLGQAYRSVYLEQERVKSIMANGSWFDGFNEGFREFKKNLPTVAEEGKSVFNSLKSGVSDAARELAKFIMTGELSFSDFATSIIQDMIRIQLESAMLRGISGLGSLFGLGSSGGGYSSSVSLTGAGWTPSFDSIVTAGRAGGGPVYPGKLYPVGEQGMELFAPWTHGTIISNDQLKRLMNAENGPEIFISTERRVEYDRY